MKTIHYNTKNEDGKFIMTKLYPTETEAEKITSLLLSPKRPPQIDFRGNILKTANIEIFDEDENPKIDKMREWTRKIADWNAYRNKIVLLPPQEKGRHNLRVYQIMWCSHTGDWEMKRTDEATDIAKEFFIQNPARAIIDLMLWKHLFPYFPESQDNPFSLKADMRMAGMRYMTDIMRQDMYDAKYFTPVEIKENEIDVKQMFV